MDKQGFIGHAKKYGVVATFACYTLFGLYLIISANGFVGGGDTISHYLISRYSFVHPELFLDHWGKPVFTLLTAPFAQLGIYGMYAYNLLVILTTSYLMYRIVKGLNLKYALLASLFAFLMPIYTPMVLSGLTEPTFALNLVLGIFLIQRKKFVLAATVISLIPLVRTEGFVFLPLFAIYLAWVKNWKGIPFLSFGFLLYSFIGWFVFDDFLWLVNQQPYRGAENLYGSGNLLHFVLNYPIIFGSMLTYLAVLGTSFYAINYKQINHLIPILMLILACFGIYMAAHSYVWWKGQGSSAGLLRVMGGIAPLLSVFAVYAVEWVSDKLERPKIIIPLVILLAIYFQRSKMILPYELGKSERIMSDVVEWFKESKYIDYTTIYYHPFVLMKMNEDPFDKLPFKATKKYLEKLNDPIIYFWDSDYGDREANMPHELLSENKHMHLLNRFGDSQDNCFVYLFSRDSIADNSMSTYIDFDFESDIPNAEEANNVSTLQSHSGSKSYHIQSSNEFSNGIRIALNEFPRHSFKSFTISAYIYAGESYSESPVLIDCTIKDGDNMLYYESSGAMFYPIKKNQWNRIVMDLHIPITPQLADKELLIYFYNRDKKEVFIDDFKIEHFRPR